MAFLQQLAHNVVNNQLLMIQLFLTLNHLLRGVNSLTDFFFLRFYLFIHERHRQREKQAPCSEPDVGLDPASPGSHPGLKANAKPLSHQGIPFFFFPNQKTFVAHLQCAKHQALCIQTKGALTAPKEFINKLGPQQNKQLKYDAVRREGQDGRRVGSPSHLSPPNYLDKLQIIEFGLRFKERTAGMLQ